MGDNETPEQLNGKKKPAEQKEEFPPPPPPPDHELPPPPPRVTVHTAPKFPTTPATVTQQPTTYPPPPAPQRQPYYYPPYQQVPQYQQPSYYPQPAMQYAPHQTYPSPVYSWQLLPYQGRELMGDGREKRTIFVVIAALLMITAAIQFPLAGLFVYYSTSDGVDFGGTFDLQGTIRDTEGTNLSGARISIVGTSLFAISDDNGEYTIFNAPNGIWRVEAQLDGYRGETRRVLLQELMFNEVNFELRDGGGSEEVNDLWFFISLAILTVMFSLFVLAGAMYSFRGQRFPVVLVGGILGLFTMSPALALWFLPLIFILGIIGFFTSMCAMLLTVWHRRDFKQWTPKREEYETAF